MNKLSTRDVSSKECQLTRSDLMMSLTGNFYINKLFPGLRLKLNKIQTYFFPNGVRIKITKISEEPSYTIVKG